MEVEYQLTYDDILAFSRHMQKHGLKVAPVKLRGLWFWGYWIILAGVIALAVTPPRVNRMTGPFPDFLVGWFAGAVTCLYAAVGKNKGLMRGLRECYEEGHARWNLAPRRLVLSPEGF